MDVTIFVTIITGGVTIGKTVAEFMLAVIVSQLWR